jgi:hypothetical protein
MYPALSALSPLAGEGRGEGYCYGLVLVASRLPLLLCSVDLPHKGGGNKKAKSTVLS